MCLEQWKFVVQALAQQYANTPPMSAGRSRPPKLKPPGGGLSTIESGVGMDQWPDRPPPAPKAALGLFERLLIPFMLPSWRKKLTGELRASVERFRSVNWLVLGVEG